MTATSIHAAPARSARRRALPDLRPAGPVLALAVICLGFALAEPHFATAANLRAIVEAAAIPLILTTGASFAIVMGSIDLSVEGVIGAACVAVTLLTRNSINAHDLGVAGIGIALAIGAFAGALNGVLNVQARLPSLMVTIGTWFVWIGFGYIIFPSHQPEVRYPPLLQLATGHVLGFTPVVFLALAMAIFAHLVFRFTAFGRRLLAIGGDEGIAIASGIPVRRCRIAAFAVAGLLSAVAAVCIAGQLGNGYPNAGHGLLFPTIGASVIGGTLLSGGHGGPFHSAVGVLILTVLDNGMIQLGVGPYARSIIIGGAIIVAVALGNWHQRARLRVVK